MVLFDHSFTRYFYEYKEPERADALLARFMAYEKALSSKIAFLQRGAKDENQ